MYRTWQIIIRPKGKNRALYRILNENMMTSKTVYNQTLFYIRNLYTGLRKEENRRTTNEKTVIENVYAYIYEINTKNIARGKTVYSFPDRTNPFLGISLLVSVMTRVFRDNFELDKDMPAKLVQNVVRQASRNFTSFFGQLKEYKKNPGKFYGHPKIPGYLKGDCGPLRYDRQMITVKKREKGCWLSFTKTKAELFLGHFNPEQLIETTVKKFHDRVKICICYKTEDEKEYELDKTRILGIDPGVKNFAAVCNNFGETPFIINGGRICSLNQYYNKKKAYIQSQLIKDNNRYYSKKISRLGRYRYCHIHDFFHKAASYIVNYALLNRAGTIVIGHNDGWKQKTILSKKVAQKFEAIPHSRFIFILKDKAERYGINVVIVEESYTSKASLLDMDSIPVYGVRDTAGLYYFSGRRVKRGIYEASGGRTINADINGAGNIIRKYDPYAMDLNLDYLVQSVKIINVA